MEFVDYNGNNVSDILNHYTIGSIFITTTNINPGTFIGGTWEAFGTGRTLVGVDTSQTEFNTVLKTGGEKTHKLTLDEMPSHTHRADRKYMAQVDISFGYGLNTGNYYIANMEVDDTLGKAAGGNKTHNNLQPFITVYFWKRTK